MPDLAFEISAGAPAALVCGVDEVGRSPLAGPVVAAAVVLIQDRMPAAMMARVDDSKVVPRPLREEISAALTSGGWAFWGVGEASVAEIDEINILQASHLAMRRAVAALGCAPAHALVDGKQCPGLAIPRTMIVGGDGLSLSIACASIVAKVHRDRLMHRLAADHPGYGWETNVGYPTKVHREALVRQGPTPHHRRSFAPVAACF